MFFKNSVLTCGFILSGWLSPTHGQQLKTISNSIGMKLVLILPGEFSMGTKEGKTGNDARIVEMECELRHEVSISNSFYLGAYEVTQRQFNAMMGFNPSSVKGDELPVESVCWTDAELFCKLLSKLPDEKTNGREYRLPTEAEWEYSCRAGCSEEYCFGESIELLKEYAWFGEVLGNPHPVGLKKANRWGLFDMHGNVREWCHDYYDEYPPASVTDPTGPGIGETRVFRGGCFYSEAENCRASTRRAGNESTGNRGIGIRVAASVKKNATEKGK